ncbi:MAG: folate family ECF transporter S component [Clostridia bacterium]|nr:folate family ECF transporter S component [Clostridia bacterium]
MSKKESIRKLTTTAMLIALSVIIGMFCKTFLNFGAGLFRVTFENIPILMAGIIMGPITGGVVGLSSDLLSYLLSPQTYPPNLIVTLGATMVGVVAGLVSKFLVKRRGSVQIIASGALAHIVGSMIIKPIGLFQFYQYLVFLRIPFYMVIAPIEIMLICVLLRRKSFAAVVGYVDKMKKEEALEYIHSINWTFCKLGLERIGELCTKLGNPQDSLRFIHVAGTNGKGSFCSMLSSVLKEQGYCVGMYTSPYIKCFNERMQINGEPISDGELTQITEKIKPIADQMDDKPTEFELVTAIAFEYFKNHKCDYVVLECGLGGRLDSTNIINTPVLSVITGIALDHTSILGDTIEKIAGEKAGIIKEGVAVLWCGTDKEAQEVISNASKEKNAPLFTVNREVLNVKNATLDGTFFDYGEHKDLKISLLGEYQTQNAMNVLCAVDLLRDNGVKIDESSIKAGLEKAKWQARFEIISQNPLVIFDGCHNPQGVDSCVESIKKYFGAEKLIVITGVMADKDYNYISNKIGQIAKEVYCIAPNNPRALSAGEYAKEFEKQGIPAFGCESVGEAAKKAIMRARELGAGVVCLGSLYMYSEVESEIKKNSEF